MIEVFEGRLGGGKTLYAVERLVKYIAQGGSVFTNIEINYDAVRAYLRKKFSWEIQPGQYNLLQGEQISLFHRHTAGGSEDCPTLVIIDEAHIWLNARNWAKASEELLCFLTQSRKTNTDIIFISQSYLNIDKQIARLTQYIWRFRDMEKFRIPGLGIKWPVRQFLRVQFDYDGKTVLQRMFVPKDKNIYNLYYTNNLLREFPRLESKKKVQGKINTRRKDMIKIFIVFVVCLGGYLGYKNYADGGILESIKPKTKYNAAAVPGTTPRAINYSEEKESRIVRQEKYKIVMYDEKQIPILIKTEKQTYRLGELCDIGKVHFMSDYDIRGLTFEGKPFMVQNICQDKNK